MSAIVPASQRSLKNRVPIRVALGNTLTMAYRNLLLIRRTPQQLFDVTIQPILFTLMFAFLFGGAISGSVSGYLPIIIPGILAQTALTASMATGVQLREDMDKGVFYRFKSMPIARIAPLTGPLLADVLRYTIATTLTFVMGYLLGFRWATPGGALMAGLLAVFASWCLSWVFALLGVMAKTAQTVQGISAAILFPLGFLSGAFVPTSTLPVLLQDFVNVNPLTYVVSAVRQLLNQGTIGNDFWLSLAGSVAVVLVFAPLTLKAYMRKA
ncbi:MAG TPA: ABC transporter permease [Nitrososphaerales archaeon]|nr:ABC transporter permease [Nitrososphaerales archaeon]